LLESPLIIHDINEIISIVTSIIKTSKENSQK
jgi:hypothetical protein